MAHTPSSHNNALNPVAQSARVFGWSAHAALWFSLGVGLLVMQIGAYLVPAVGTRDAMLAIVLGSVIGAGLQRLCQVAGAAEHRPAGRLDHF